MAYCVKLVKFINYSASLLFSGLPGRASSTTVDGGDGGSGDGGGGNGGRGGDGLDVERGRLEGRDPEGVNVAGSPGRLLAVAWVRNGGIRISKQLQFVAMIYCMGDNIYTKCSTIQSNVILELIVNSLHSGAR